MSTRPMGSPDPERSEDRGVERSPVDDGGSSTPSNDSSIIDWNEAYRRIPGGAKTVLELSALMLDECPKLVAEIHDGIADGDTEKLRRGAHTLRGSADVFGANRVVGVAHRLQELGRVGELERASLLLEDLDRETGRLIEALERVVRRGSLDE